jgi:ribonuclease R
MKQEKHVTGKLQINAKGFGFLLLEEGADIFIAYDNLANAMDGDTVEVVVFNRGKKPSGKIVRVIERSGRTIIGIFRRAEGGGKVYPEDERLPSSLFIPQREIDSFKDRKNLKEGRVVTAELIEWKDPKKKPRGTVTAVLGDQDEPGMDLKVVALSYGLPLDFPEKIAREAKTLRDPVINKEVKDRLDLRKLDCFTIDPESAKDFDDALSLRQLPSGLFEVGVHIADVSHFVPEGGIIDKEAWERGTSVYFVQKVLPMLPERLSNEICSLVPNKPRLAFSVLMELDSLGELHDYQIRESVIRSKQRFTYEEVEAVIKGGTHKYAPALHLMQVLSQVLRKRREEKGSIDFDMTETVITLDKEGIPRTIKPKESLQSHRLVEEFMLLANKVVAGHIIKAEKELERNIPFVYRVHEKPAEKDVTAFLATVSNLGIPYKIGKTVEPDDYRNILGIIENLEFKNLVEKVALQSMTKAVYSTENRGHFGLAFDAYTHFTSPIRRYPDLVVHRLLKHYLQLLPTDLKARRKAAWAKKQLADTKKRKASIEETCAHSNKREKIAVSAEREYSKIKSLEFLAKKLGHSYEGVITGVTSFGLFVEISHYLIEGLVHVSKMKDDHYQYDSENYLYKGERSGKVYRLGDLVKVKIERVSVEDRKADFSLVN